MDDRLGYPWKATKESGCFHAITNTRGLVIATTMSGTNAEYAYLIAAAPELLDALKLLRAWACNDGKSDVRILLLPNEQILSIVNDAIAKAEGKDADRK